MFRPRVHTRDKSRWKKFPWHPHAVGSARTPSILCLVMSSSADANFSHLRTPCPDLGAPFRQFHTESGRMKPHGAHAYVWQKRACRCYAITYVGRPRDRHSSVPGAQGRDDTRKPQPPLTVTRYPGTIRPPSSRAR